MASRPWTRSETLIALNLYCRTPFGKLHARNPDIAATAKSLGRTPSALAMKCCNLAAFDPTLKARKISGLSKTSRLDREVWEQFAADPESIGFESELALANLRGTPPEVSPIVSWECVEGLDKTAITKVRVNQSFFRSMIVSGYRYECCVCTLPIQSLLVAAHIVPWSRDASLRMNPTNGLCLCVLHERAFDRGLFTISENYVIRLHSKVANYSTSDAVQTMLQKHEGQCIALPDRWRPDAQLLGRHAAIFDDIVI